MARMRTVFPVGILFIVLIGILGSCTAFAPDTLHPFPLVSPSALENTLVASSSDNQGNRKGAVEMAGSGADGCYT
jgi:hypothetical protein